MRRGNTNSAPLLDDKLGTSSTAGAAFPSNTASLDGSMSVNAGLDERPIEPGALLAAEEGEAQETKAGSVGIVFTLWNTMMGSTLLVMPYTFQQAGWLLCLVLSIVCAVLMQFTCSLILQYSQSMMDDPSAEFADLAYLHFGEAGRLAAFLSGNVVVMAAAVAMHGYMATVLSHLVAYPFAHGGFCPSGAVNASAFAEHALELARPPPSESPCLAPFINIIPPVHDHAPPPILVIGLVLLVFPLANLPSIKLLARLNTVGVVCFGIILLFAYISAGVAGVSPSAFTRSEMIRPASAGVIFGIFSLSFFIHNAVMTIMRGAARPKNNRRDINIAFALVWVCYASMGVSANICPPLGDIAAVGGPLSKNGFLSLQQKQVMAPLLIVARLAVLIQSITVYPVLLFIVRSQIFTAFIYKRAYPGVLPTLICAALQAAVTTAFTAGGVDIADVLKFAGAFGGLVCCFCLPALIHGSVHRKEHTLTPLRGLTIVILCAFGILCVAMQIIPAPSDGTANHTTTLLEVFM